MPPPPNPQPVILEPELQALKTCLKNAVFKTGQIYSFYADRARLYLLLNMLSQHPYKPPDSLVASLGREIEQYDQLCDSIESHLLRAIAVLKRDLKREEQRKRDVTLAAAKIKTAEALRPAETLAALETASSQDVPPAPISSPVAASAGPGRRPSAISISSLQRPTIPLKLDLSAPSLRMPDDPVHFSGGLASPVTLAPKSARPLGPNEFPPDFMAALASATSATNASGRGVDIDLTVEDDNTRLSMAMTLDPTAGSSADKPIELDLDNMDIDMVELFGDTVGHEESPNTKTTMDGLFSSHKTPSNDSEATKKGQKEDGSFLPAYHGDVGSDIFSQHDPKEATPDGHQTLLTDFASDQSGYTGPPINTNAHTTAAGPSSFDIASLDLTNFSPSFFSNTGDPEFSVDDLLSMGGNTGDGKNSSTNVS
ncbi:hypothetical protein M378DRAFT_66252 [Amanita muscaria Koide BX008]|uniref:Uncharacterized protein n=1 Tax=Amanita muscaria (strain Koide BX008) TaxID=946122 RepID=A0A0C2X8B1_AMAMK|nr:hypothetical protein M378DRAFT_66252 [Amanita muscaria Koide BX008]